LTVTATYSINSYTVTFVDWNGAALKTETVKYGHGATAPADPTRTGWTFAGWDAAFNNITGDLTVTALYQINTYIVTFVDYDGTVLSTQTIDYGSGAVAPADPNNKEGWHFVGWNADFSQITEALVVTALYEINRYTVTFVDWDGRVIDRQTVNHGSGAAAPADPVRMGQVFTGWDEDFDYITGSLTVTALYDSIKITIFKPQTGNTNNVYANGILVGTMGVETKTFTLADGQNIRVTLHDRGQGNNVWVTNFTWTLITGASAQS
jgi:hypothetical protein